jgi:hypothetical protein
MSWDDFMYFSLGACGLFVLCAIYQQIDDIKHRLRRMHHASRSDSKRT